MLRVLADWVYDPVELRARRRENEAAWVKAGHSSDEMRRLFKLPELPIEPLPKEPPKPTKRKK